VAASASPSDLQLKAGLKEVSLPLEIESIERTMAVGHLEADVV
jgi:hypothetical protein